MKFIKSIVFFSSISFFVSCEGNTQKEVVKPETPITISHQVDNAVKQLQTSISSYKIITTLDHHRMAARAGVYTPPSIATIFSDSKINIPLVFENQLVGLDMPFKILCYAEPDTINARVAFTSSEFIQKRHNLDANLLADYKSNMRKILASFPKEIISTTEVSNIKEGFGIVSIKSDYDYSTTVNNLKNIVQSQEDTKWFADIDYQKEASTLGVILRPTTLLLFGGPAPGGKAMSTTPKIGLDAFCQKLLVYEKSNGEVWVAYNDIVAFAQLYYQTSTKPQQMISQRLKKTFTKAIEKQAEE